MKEKFLKTQNNDVFISPKWKNTILEMSLKLSVVSKLDQFKEFELNFPAQFWKLLANLTG
jgi:hypothetical protein